MKISVKYPVLIYAPTTFRTWFYSQTQLTKAPTQITASLNEPKMMKKVALVWRCTILFIARRMQRREFGTEQICHKLVWQVGSRCLSLPLSLSFAFINKLRHSPSLLSRILSISLSLSSSQQHTYMYKPLSDTHKLPRCNAHSQYLQWPIVKTVFDRN